MVFHNECGNPDCTDSMCPYPHGASTAETVPPSTVPTWRAEYLAKRQALAELMEAHKVTIAARRVDSRPDADSEWHKDSCHAAFDVLHNGRIVYSGHYSAGSLAAIPDTLQAFRAAYTKGRGKGWNPDLPSAPGFHPDIKKTFDRRQSPSKTQWESDILECVRRAWLPESVDVIQSLLSDATEESFSDWCGDLGMDTDSRKALAMWETCREIDRVMRRCFGAYYETAQDIAREF